MLHINSELLIQEPIEPNYNNPVPVQEHVTALGNYANVLLQDGKVSPEAAAFSRLFAQRHDAGYGVDVGILQSDYAYNILGAALDAVESPVDPDFVARYLRYNADNYTAARIIGHGVLGLVENTRYFQEEHRLSARKALGLASILSAHHPNYPITMVSGFLSGDATIPPEARSAFFIDDGGEDPEKIRGRLAELGAAELGIHSRDAVYAAVLGYSLDRLSAGSTPDEIALLPNGTVQLHGGEVVQKKYALVAGDLRRDETIDDPSIEQLFAVVNDRLRYESTAATQAASGIGEQDLFHLIQHEAATIAAATSSIQYNALQVIDSLGLSGRFSQLGMERDALQAYAYRTNDPYGLYALATYDVVS